MINVNQLVSDDSASSMLPGAAGLTRTVMGGDDKVDEGDDRVS